MVDSESWTFGEDFTPEVIEDKGGFKFPPPPIISYLEPDISTASDDEEDWASSDEEKERENKKRLQRKSPKYPTSPLMLTTPYHNLSNDELPPIGIFWDIENCQVPKGCSAVAVVAAIRNAFLPGRREAEFTVVCDARKEQPSLLQDLNDAQVSLLHVCGTQKNAADDKLRQCMRRYAELHAGVPPSPRSTKAPPALLLISGDVNFAADLSDFRHRKKMEVILVHKSNTSKALMACSSHHHCFMALTAPIPRNFKQVEYSCTYCVEVDGVPPALPGGTARLARRLQQLANNCGGKVLMLRPPLATLRFQTHHQALRALKRMDGEDVFGHKIRVLPPIRTYYNGNVRSSSDEGYHTGAGRPVSAPPAPLVPVAPLAPPMPTFPPLPYCQSHSVMEQPINEDAWSNGTITQSYSEEILGTTFKKPMDRTPTGFRSIKGTHGNKSVNNVSQLLPGGYQASPSPSPSPVLSVTPSPSPSPTMLDLTAWNISERSMSEHSSEARSGSPPGSPPFVDITVTNLEHSADPQTVRNMLHRIFSEHVPVVDVSVRGTAESLSARVRVSGAGAAQLAVARLHRRRVAGRRLLLSLAPPPPATPLPMLRRQVAALLQGAPDQQLPLFRLRELYAARHGRTLPAGEVSRLKDTCVLVDSPRGRSVRLIRAPPDTNHHTEWWGESETCVMHGGPPHEENTEGGPPGGVGVQAVYAELPTFTQQLHTMLGTHGGVLLLNSLPQCYAAQFGEPLNVDPVKGVPLEHLVSSCRGVALRSSPAPHPRKLIVLAPTPTTPNSEVVGSQPSTPVPGSGEEDLPGSLASLRALLARELLDLLRTVPRCQMPFSRLIPSYHLHFGRQCRVADYGFTRLADLLDSLSHTVQVMGEGSGRMITLSHAAQMKRFTADLLKVLRAQPDKSLLLDQLPQLYKRTLGRDFEPVEYGACKAEDLVNGVARSCVALGPEEGRISLPRHRQTPEEIARIRHFALQAVELLRHAPNCRLELSRFVPAYHTHFGRQLRVAHYGLPKVQDLFHAIPDTVEMWVNEEGERIVGLRPEAARGVLSAQLAALPLPLSFAALPHAYRNAHGHALLPAAYGCPDLITLLRTLPGIKVIDGCGEGGALITLSDSPAPNVAPGGMHAAGDPQGWGPAALLSYRVLAGDRCVSSGGPPLEQFCQEFRELAGYDPPLQVLKQNNCIKVSNYRVVLPLLWRCVGRLVAKQGDQMLSGSTLAQLYHQQYQHPLPFQRLGFDSVDAMIVHCIEIWESHSGMYRVRNGLSSLLPPVCKPRVDLLPNTPPGQKSSGVWSTPPAVARGPWRAPPAPPAPSQLPLPAPQLLSSTTVKRRVRLAAQFDGQA